VSTPANRIIAAVRSVEHGTATRDDALRAVSTDDVTAVLHAQLGAGDEAIVLCSGIGASPGAAVGRICLSVDAVLDTVDRGEPAILVASETGPADEIGMRESVGILTARGGLASHAAVVARGWGIPAVCGAEMLEVEATAIRVGALVLHEGDIISLDGASGRVLVGELAVDHADAPPELDTLLAWADDIRAGRLGVRANADTAHDAERARSFGAEGIGLCRTEHMFLGERLPTVQAMILADDDAAEEAALAALYELQVADFEGILTAMDGLPVTVRLLDPPLHEFLPPIEELAVEAALGALDDARRGLLEAARYWQEQNPMIGTRGVRLAILRPRLYRMQVRALLDAVARRREAGGHPVAEIMVPLVVNEAELSHVRGWIDEEIAAAGITDGSVKVGTMIETPRAALVAGAIAAVADFVSFGTNDLTQMTFGFSRDDVESRLLKTYLAQGLLAANPFEHLDTEGVGALVADAVIAGRTANPELKAGVCGEHGGDPVSIRFFADAGLDYVSCSPPRVPVARLAAAQWVLS
jgi:pyruvate,orthophosphate dikinase